MKGIISKNTYCIYLDQYATSGIFESENGLWQEIKELLSVGVNSNRIICPRSAEHFLESSQKEANRAVSLDKRFSQLTKGYAFKAELFITSQLLISKIRNNNITSKTYFYNDIAPDILSHSDKLNSFIDIKKEFDDRVSQSVSLTNNLRKVPSSSKLDKKTKLDSLKKLKSLSEKEFIDRLGDLLRYGKIRIEGAGFESADIPNWVDLVIHQLLQKHKMTITETEKLQKHIQENGFDQIPTLDIKNSLMSFVAVENKIENPSDQIDFMRISTGLPVSDILLTDKKRKFELVTLELDKKYKTTVFSGVQQDLEEFKKELQQITL